MTTLTTLPAIETPSLVIREIELRDTDTFGRFMTQDAYQRHIAMRLANMDEVRAFVTRSVARQGDERRNVFHLAAEEKLSGEAVGDGFIIKQRPTTLEIGWGVHPAMWQMGLGTEIGHALLSLAFERLKAERVWCKVMTPNTASARLAQRIGMKSLPSHPDFPVARGRGSQIEFFTLTASEYFDLPY